MEAKSAFELAFARAKEGESHYDFAIDPAFFIDREGSIIQKGWFDIEVILNKHSAYSTLTFLFAGKVETDCDRCLDPMMLPLAHEQKLMIKYGVPDRSDEQDEVLYIQKDTDKISLSDLMYEYITLAMPMQKYCEDIEKECNPVVIDKMIDDSEDLAPSNPLAEQLKEIKLN